MKWSVLPVLIWVLSACQPSPKPIEYGTDACQYCKMTIVDPQHGAEAVTRKGKVHKFDAIECLINFVAKEGGEEAFPFLLVNDYYAPGELLDARTSAYLISRNLPSPMGAFLTAFADREAALRVQADKGGEVFDWKGVGQYLRENGIVK